MNRYPSLLIYLLWVLPAISYSAENTMVDIQAEQIEMNQKTGVVLFKGNVQVRRGSIRLVCQTLRAEYADGQLIRLHAQNGVRAESDTFVVTAQTAHFDPAEKRIELTGRPRLQRGESHLSGEKVTVWVDTEKVVVHKAKGRFDPALLKTTQPTKK
jgi:lipopolysaccharide transport protein LptA